jgi:23S rRNA (cytosine1962-C5)-methyltransferase
VKTLLLKREEERRLLGGHLWIYSNEVDTARSPLPTFSPGEQVWVKSYNGRLLGTAYVNPQSLIVARLVSRDDQPLDRDRLVKRLRRALALRQRLYPEPYYRLVYGESDGLPGLIVDRFGNHLCVQLNTAGMEALRDQILKALDEVLAPQSILFRNDSSIRQREGLPEEIQAALGTVPARVEVVENGVHLSASLQGGQKTGWFYDQRPNRAWLRGLAGGLRVLDVFCYAGAFAAQAAAWGAREVVAVDASLVALQQAEENVRQAAGGEIFTGIQGDAFDILKGLRGDGEQFDLIIVDPPAFIKKKKDHREGLLAYQRINDLAMALLAPDSLLLSASCSMHLDREELLSVLHRAGHRQGRLVQLLSEGMQGPDHPVHPAIPETRYLKAFLVRAVAE